jgi:hypothetical protein
MPTWEYCAIGRVSCDTDGHYGVELVLTLFGSKGRQTTKYHTKYGEHSYDQLNELIVWLGQAGWEMVGVGNTAEQSHSIYFKRLVKS